jgi:hypothetical protein
MPVVATINPRIAEIHPLRIDLPERAVTVVIPNIMSANIPADQLNGKFCQWWGKIHHQDNTNSTRNKGCYR